VSKVEFYVDSNLLGTDTSSPYSYSWATTSYTNGAHSLQAKAYDAANNIGSSSSVSVTVSNAVSDTTAPTCSISAPSAGATVSGTTAFSATASDNVGVAKVEFYVDSALKSTDTSSPYSYSWDTTTATNAAHSLLAKAYDAANNVGTSPSVSVTVSNGGTPTYVLTNGVASSGSLAASGSQVWTIAVNSGATSMVTSVTMPSGADFDSYGKLGSAPTTSSYTWRGYTSNSPEVVTYANPGAGTWYIMPQSYSGSGAYTVTCTITYGSADTTLPTCSLTAPTAGATVSGTVSVTATASDNVGVTKVEFWIDGALKGTDTSSPYSYSWVTTTYANSAHSIVAKAYDAAGNVKSSTTVTVTVNNAATSGPPYSLSGTCDPNPTFTVHLVAGNTVKITLSWTATSNDLDFWLYRVGGSTSSYLVRGYTTANPETASWTVDVTADYIIQVDNYDDISGVAFTLSVVYV
jgi:hypothetical protein